MSQRSPALNARPLRQNAPRARRRLEAGLATLDVLLGLAIFALVVVIGVQSFQLFRERAYVTQATADANQLGMGVTGYLTSPDAKVSDLPNGEASAPQLADWGVRLTTGSRAWLLHDGARFAACVQNEKAYGTFDGARVDGGRLSRNPGGCDAALTDILGTPEPGAPDGTGPGGGAGEPTAAPLLAGPENVRITSDPAIESAALAWDPIDSATGYVVYLDGADTPAWSGATPTATLEHVTAGQRAVHVAAVIGGVETQRTSVSVRVYGDNDFVAHAHPIHPRADDTVATRTYTLAGATAETGETDSARYLSRWWTITAEFDGTYEVKLDPSFYNSQVDAWVNPEGRTPDQFGTATLTGASSAKIALDAGDTALVRVSSTNGSRSATYRLTVTVGPSNDSWRNPRALQAPAAKSSTLTPDVLFVNAGSQQGEAPADKIFRSLWFNLVAPRTGTYTVSTERNDAGDPVSYQAASTTWINPPSDAKSIAELGTPAHTVTPSSTHALRAGDVLRVRYYSTQEDRWSPYKIRVATGQTNDAFDAPEALPVPAAGATVLTDDQTQVNSGVEAGETGVSRSLWYRFVAPRNGTYEFSAQRPTSGSGLHYYYTHAAWVNPPASATKVSDLPAATGTFTGGGTWSRALNAGDVVLVRVASTQDKSGEFRFQVKAR